jgi:hypothetical protein
MPAPKNKRQKKTITRPIWRRKLFWIVAVVLLIGAGVVTPIVFERQKEKAIAADRLRFEQADKDVKEVADAIVAAVGQPLKTSESKSCSRRSTKWEKAPLSCITSKYIFFEVSDSSNATVQLSKIKPIVSMIWQLEHSQYTNNLNGDQLFKGLPVSQYDSLTSHQTITYVYHNNLADIECSVSNAFYMSSKPPYNEYAVNSRTDLALAIGIKCKGTTNYVVYNLSA